MDFFNFKNHGRLFHMESEIFVKVMLIVDLNLFSSFFYFYTASKINFAITFISQETI